MSIKTFRCRLDRLEFLNFYSNIASNSQKPTGIHETTAMPTKNEKKKKKCTDDQVKVK